MKQGPCQCVSPLRYEAFGPTDAAFHCTLQSPGVFSFLNASFGCRCIACGNTAARDVPPLFQNQSAPFRGVTKMSDKIVSLDSAILFGRA
jgi:hypothetical protein